MSEAFGTSHISIQTLELAIMLCARTLESHVSCENITTQKAHKVSCNTLHTFLLPLSSRYASTGDMIFFTGLLTANAFSDPFRFRTCKISERYIKHRWDHDTG